MIHQLARRDVRVGYAAQQTRAGAEAETQEIKRKDAGANTETIAIEAEDRERVRLQEPAIQQAKSVKRGNMSSAGCSMEHAESDEARETNQSKRRIAKQERTGRSSWEERSGAGGSG